jgi:micrococcal nuclease
MLRDLGRPSIASLALLVFIVILLLQQGQAGDDDAESLPNTVQAEVTRAVDGDTVEALVEGREQDVRYIGVDTPESVQPDAPIECFGPEAANFNRRLVEGERVMLTFDAERRDDYGRLLAYVRLMGGDEAFVNAELVRRGYATTLEIEPNTRYAERFAELEREAARAGRGLWEECGP